MKTCRRVEKVKHRIAEMKKTLNEMKSVMSICRWLSIMNRTKVTATHNAPIKCVQMFTVSLWMEAIEMRHSRTELAGGRCFCKRKWLSPSHSRTIRTTAIDKGKIVTFSRCLSKH